MTNPPTRPTPEKNQYMSFLAYMGLALTSWTKVEDTHFEFFKTMLPGVNAKICSVLYHSPPTFESRRVLVDRVAELYLDKKFKKRWTKLNIELGECASHRGQLAHYGINFEITFPDGEEQSLDNFIVAAVRLRPSEHDHVKVMQGKTGEKHTVTMAKIGVFVRRFDALKSDLGKFTLEAHGPPPPPYVGFLSGLSLDPPKPAEFPPLPPPEERADGEPFE
jgi:hypothetical protein